MNSAEQYLAKALEQRRLEHSLRSLFISQRNIDFCSNDYLGLARHTFPNDSHTSGSGGSRLLSGNSNEMEALENFLAHFHQAPSALLFNSGYTANLALFSCIPQRGDTIIYDEHIHASVRDGIRMGFARAFAFRHNDAEDLEAKLKQGSGRIYIAIESIYSMEGDMGILQESLQLAEQYDAAVIVDEAHSNGLYGPGGSGLCIGMNLHNRIFARLYTFGKAIGCHGAVVVGSLSLKQYLVNFARPLIYTTSMPPHQVAQINQAYGLVQQMGPQRAELFELVNYFREYAAKHNLYLLPSTSPIQSLLIPGNSNARNMAIYLQEQGFDIRAILHPTVPEGKERLRIIIHHFNSRDEINRLIQHLVA